MAAFQKNMQGAGDAVAGLSRVLSFAADNKATLDAPPAGANLRLPEFPRAFIRCLRFMDKPW